MSRILVAGSIAGAPGQGGATWAVLQYVLGFRRLGHAVTLVEPAAALPPAEVIAYFDRVVEEFDLSAALLVGERESVGLSYDELLDTARAADVLVNISGMLRNRDLRRAPVRVYLDLDPAFNQLWHLDGIDVGLKGHTHYMSVGLGVGNADGGVPSCGLDWTTTVPPVVLEHWPVAESFERDAYTTVGNWRGYGAIERDGKHYGQRAHSARRFLDLPQRSEERFELALSIHPGEKDDLDALRAHGWTLLDPAEVAGTPAAYGAFIRGSKAELGIAKSGYVVSASGWFSDRSACYLASGRPVVAQDTGFSRFLPTGGGLFAFDDTEGAVAATVEVRDDYAGHARAARGLAEELFDSDLVLGRFLERVGAG